MKVNISIVPNDVNNIVKIVFFDNKMRVLMLKREKYLDKYGGEWDLPGGHLREGEDAIAGLRREVFEETGIGNFTPKLHKKIKNKSFYFSGYKSNKISLSHEHTEHKFFSAEELNPRDDFQSIALEILDFIKK
jgi:8-oxo-dGTP diphosphatase